MLGPCSGAFQAVLQGAGGSGGVGLSSGTSACRARFSFICAAESLPICLQSPLCLFLMQNSR